MLKSVGTGLSRQKSELIQNSGERPIVSNQPWGGLAFAALVEIFEARQTDGDLRGEGLVLLTNCALHISTSCKEHLFRPQQSRDHLQIADSSGRVSLCDRPESFKMTLVDGADVGGVGVIAQAHLFPAPLPFEGKSAPIALRFVPFGTDRGAFG